MILNRGGYLALLFLPLIFTLFSLILAVLDSYGLGKSKTKINKDKKTIPFAKKIFLIGYAERCKYRRRFAKLFCYIYWIYLSTVLLCLILLIFSMIFPMIEPIFTMCVLIKLFVLDLPVIIYSFIATKHDKKHGGSNWRWIDKY